MSLSIREHYKNKFPEEYRLLFDSARKYAEEIFSQYPDVLTVNIPFCVPLSADSMPTMAYLILNRNLQEVDEEGNEIIV